MLNILVLKITNSRRNKLKERVINDWKHFDIKGLQDALVACNWASRCVCSVSLVSLPAAFDTKLAERVSNNFHLRVFYH